MEIQRIDSIEYLRWLEDYISWGGKPTHYLDCDLSQGIKKLYIATADFEMEPLFGKDAIKVIVPKNVNVISSEVGDNQLYFYDFSLNHKNLHVPIFPYHDAACENLRNKIYNIVNYIQNSDDYRKSDSRGQRLSEYELEMYF